MCSFLCVLSVNCFCAITAEFNSYDRDYMAWKPKIYTFWPFIKKKNADPLIYTNEKLGQFFTIHYTEVNLMFSSII